MFRKTILWIVVSFVGSIFLIFAAFLTSPGQGRGMDPDGLLTEAAQVNDQVKKWKPLVEKDAQQAGISGYVPVILAIIQQESGGQGPDVMKSSESLGLVPNTLQDPKRSIQAGVQKFANDIRQTNGQLGLALQAYNFGDGFIRYAQRKGGYSPAVAQSFSNMMATKLGGDDYGDPEYVKHVLAYIVPNMVAGKANNKGFVLPVHSKTVTSAFGNRPDPVGPGKEFHAGIDLSCHHQDIPVFASKAGTVQKAGWQNPDDPHAGFGQRVYVKSDKMTIIYGHLSERFVKVGDKVNAGQPIGRCGSTGSSTGLHLHFEIQVNGKAKDPLSYLVLK